MQTLEKKWTQLKGISKVKHYLDIKKNMRGKQKTRKFVNGGQQSQVFSATVMTLTVYLSPALSI